MGAVPGSISYQQMVRPANLRGSMITISTFCILENVIDLFQNQKCSQLNKWDFLEIRDHVKKIRLRKKRKMNETIAYWNETTVNIFI